MAGFDRKAILFMTTHGTVKLNPNNTLPFIKTPFNTTKLDGVNLGVCNFYQPGTPNIIPRIVEKIIEEEPENPAEFIKKEFEKFENKEEMMKTRDGNYLKGLISDWADIHDSEADPDVLEFARHLQYRNEIRNYRPGDNIINKTYTVYKEELMAKRAPPVYENRVMLFLNGATKPIDILETWKIDGIRKTPSGAAKLRTGGEVFITLEEIFETILELGLDLSELVIADLTRSVFTKKGKEITANRKTRYLAREGHDPLAGVEDDTKPGARGNSKKRKRSKKSKKAEKKKKKKKGGTKKKRGTRKNR